MTAAAALLAAVALWCARGGLRPRVVALRLGHDVGARRARSGSWRQRAARRAAVEELAAALAQELRAGAATVEGLRRAAQASADPQLRALGARADPVEALSAVAALPGGEGASAIGAALRLAASLGASPSPLLAGVVAALRVEAAQQRAVETELASAVATTRLLAGLPLLGIALGVALGADPVAVLAGTTLGRACLAGALVLEALGLRWCAAIRRRALG